MFSHQAAAYSQAGPSAGCGGGARWGHHRGRGHRGGPPWARFFGAGESLVPINIESTDASFVLTLFAAGRRKEGFTLAVQQDILTIAYQGDAGADAPDAAPDPRYTRREFRDASFERAFRLNGKVLAENIAAAYADGILTVTLPKNPDTNQPAQAISVA